MMRGQLSRFDLALDTEISPERSSFIETWSAGQLPRYDIVE
jgi:hypothetical protein